MTSNFFSRTVPAALAALALGGASVAFAQTATDAPKVRQDVKDDAKASQRAGNTVSGQQSTPTQAKGGLADAPTGTTPRSATGGTAQSPMSAASRAEVKSDAAMANKAGTAPKGELSTKDQDKGGAKGVKP